MRVLVVEDDALQAASIVDNLRAALSSASFRIVSSESAFYTLVDELEPAIAPNVIILDLMLRWTQPSPDMPTPPQEVREDGPFRSGLRCLRLLRGSRYGGHIPVILYSAAYPALNRDHIVGDVSTYRNVFMLSKSSQPEELGRLIRSLSVADNSSAGTMNTDGSPPSRAAVIGACRRGHPLWVPNGIPRTKTPGYCVKCGAPIVVDCPVCGTPVIDPSSPIVGGETIPVFCAGCGRPFSWAAPSDVSLYLQNLLEFRELDEATQLAIIEELSAIAIDGELDEDQIGKAVDSVRRRAPKLFTVILPVLQNVLSDVLKRQLGL